MYLNSQARLATASRPETENGRRLRSRKRIVFLAFFFLGLVAIGSQPMARACPFCSALAPTISDDLESATYAVIAECESMAIEEDGFRVCQMRIREVVKGQPPLADSLIEVVTAEELQPDGKFWILGYGEETTEWVAPKPMLAESADYLRHLSELPKLGSERMKYFLRFLQHEDELVAADAYNEFAEASIEDIIALNDHLDRNWVISQIRDVEVPTHRRRLCWTFLSQCGTAEDADLFDELLRRREADPMFDPGMDAAIACFISLIGEPALARIEQEYLANNEASYVDTFAAISAIRIHGTELNVLPRERFASSLRLVLKNPELSDIVIPDLARWEDWSVIDRVAELFENSTEATSFIKPKVVLYLKTCPLPAAAQTLERLRAIDADAVQAAEASMAFYSGVATVPVPAPEEDVQESNTPESGSSRIAAVPVESSGSEK